MQNQKNHENCKQCHGDGIFVCSTCAPDVFLLHGDFLIDQFITAVLLSLPFSCRAQRMLRFSLDFIQIAAKKRQVGIQPMETKPLLWFSKHT